MQPGARGCRLVSFWWRSPRLVKGKDVSLLAECLSATCNLGRKDCSNDALELCTYYAKWPNQLLFPSSAWCACLWMHCPTPPWPPFPFCLFICWFEMSWSWQTPAFPLLLYEKKTNKMVKWLFEHSIFCVWFCPLLTLYSGTSCVWVSTFSNDNRCFSYFSWFVFLLLSAVRLLIKPVYNLLQQPFFREDFSVEPDFVKALLYWPLFDTCLLQFQFVNKTRCWQMGLLSTFTGKSLSPVKPEGR